MEDVAPRRDAVSSLGLACSFPVVYTFSFWDTCSVDLATVKSRHPVFQLLSCRNALHERAMHHRAQLADSFHLQQFFRDSDELKSWVNEKMKTATDEAYKVMYNQFCHMILV